MPIFAYMKVFRYGFIFKGFLFGWYEKDLYRIGQYDKTRHYLLKKLDVIQIGQKYGYRCAGTRITIDQAKERTVLFSGPKIFHQADNMPF